METYKLYKPITFEGEDITEIQLDLDGLSQDDLAKAERTARTMLAKKEALAVPETNKKYLSCVAATAASRPLNVIKLLGAKDYTQVCLLVQNFLLDGDSEEDEEDPNSKTTAPGKTGTSTPANPEKPSTSTK